MAASSVIEVHDMARVHSLLVVPSPRGKQVLGQHAQQEFHARLAPIEMAAPSLHLQPMGGKASLPAVPEKAALVEPLASSKPRAVPAFGLPLVYALCGLTLCLCNFLVPHGVIACAHLLSPAWTLALALHALAEPDRVWAWLGALTIFLLPVTLLLRHSLFVCFYLTVLAIFGSGRFWQALHGPPFVLVCVCWFGLATSCALAFLAEHPHAQLAVATFFAIAAIVVSSAARFGRLHLEVAGPA
jgi:hypothetical protein